MVINFDFRKRAVRTLTNEIGVYVLADLDGVPIYVGQSVDGIRSRVARHLTSARSDIIANRQVDVWEIAYVWAFPVESRDKIAETEAGLFHHYDPTSQLMNGAIPPINPANFSVPVPSQMVQVMTDDEIEERRGAEQRLPRQASHYAQIVGHFLAVKNSTQIARAMDAHFDRLKRYHSSLIADALPSDDANDGD